jgi:hypothetical protein
MAPRFDAANPDVTGEDPQARKTLLTFENVRFVYAREHSQLLLLPWVLRR